MELKDRGIRVNVVAPGTIITPGYKTAGLTTPEKLWSALTDAEFMKQYWFGVHGESQWTAGSPWKSVSPQGQILDAGEIVEAERQTRKTQACYSVCVAFNGAADRLEAVNFAAGTRTGVEPH